MKNWYKHNLLEHILNVRAKLKALVLEKKIDFQSGHISLSEPKEVYFLVYIYSQYSSTSDGGPLSSKDSILQTIQVNSDKKARGGGVGGRLQYENARMCVLEIWKWTHFEWHLYL